MNEIFSSLIERFQFSDDIKKASNAFLIKHNRKIIAEHSLRVACMARLLAKKYGVDEASAEIAGYLHDLGGIFPYEKGLEIAKLIGINILPEEEMFPLILHQKLSKILAEEIFIINDTAILNAISCHTTLKANATSLDMVLFIADKIEWDQKDTPPYLSEVKEALAVSLELGTFTYLKYMWDKRESLKVIHPWLVEAYTDLGSKLNKL